MYLWSFSSGKSEISYDLKCYYSREVNIICWERIVDKLEAHAWVREIHFKDIKSNSNIHSFYVWVLISTCFIYLFILHTYESIYFK